MSPHEILRSTMNAIGRVSGPMNRPLRMLEIGPGWGIYGMLVRNFYDAWFGRFEPESFEIVIDAIDASDIEISSITRQVYNNVWIQNAANALPQMETDSYDVVFGVEVIEHLEKADGHQLIQECCRIARKGVVLTTPHPDAWQSQPNWHGNPFAEHLSKWSGDDFVQHGFTTEDVHPSIIAAWQPRPKIGVGVIFFNGMEVSEKCYPSWSAVSNKTLVLLDNGSDPEMVEWVKSLSYDHLIELPTNRGAAYGRNAIIQWFMENTDIPYLLLPDSDVELSLGMETPMVNAFQDGVGFVGYPQANKGYPVSADGYVEEIAHECAMSCTELWRWIKYPDSLIYYSSDSYASTLANAIGFRTRIVRGNGDGYTHYQHGSRVNAGVEEQAEIDVSQWVDMENQMETYWKLRFEHGKASSDLIMSLK
jgi:hypothetical protein